MARSRNIKPGFFTNDVLGELPPLARLLFAGLWTICDRSGRCEDRPKKIRAEVLPYDDCDADGLLAQLMAAGFIDRYEVAGARVIQVLTWNKHQNPHVKEAASILPARGESGACEPGAHDTGATEPSASTGQDSGEAQPQPEQAGLTPDSLSSDSSSSDSLTLDPEERVVPAVPDSTLVRDEAGTAKGRICRALRQAGIPDLNTEHPMLIELVKAGATAEELAALVPQAMSKGKPFAYLLQVAVSHRQQAAQQAATMRVGAMPAKPRSRGSLNDADLAAANASSNNEARRRLFGEPGQETIDA